MIYWSLSERRRLARARREIGLGWQRGAPAGWYGERLGLRRLGPWRVLNLGFAHYVWCVR